MLIIDAHEDIAYNALEWGRDIRDSVHVVRKREESAGCCESGDGNVGQGGIAMSGLPELRRGGVGIVFGVIFAYPSRDASSSTVSTAHTNTQVYRNAEEAYRIGRQQLAYYQRERIESNEH